MTDCFHCGLPVPHGIDLVVEIKGKDQPMCCAGCQAVAQTIIDNHLESFYDYRSENPRKAEQLIPEELTFYDQETVQKSFVSFSENNRTASLIIEGITCAACIWLNERHVRTLDGVISFDVNLTSHRARVVWDNEQIQLSAILRAISEIGYIAHPYDPGKQQQLFRKEKRQALIKLAVAGVFAVQVMMLAVALYAGEASGMDSNLKTFMRWVSMLLSTPVVFFSSVSFFRQAWLDIKKKQLGMDVPVALAIGSAYIASCWSTLQGDGDIYFDSVTMFSFFLLASRYLEMGARQRAGEVAESVARLLPVTATKIEQDTQHIVAVTDLQVGDSILVRPGETVAADGIIIEGSSSVDESLLTGESLPQGRSIGDKIVGGSINIENPLTFQVEYLGEETVVSGIARLLERAQAERPPMSHLADKIAGYFVSVVLLLALMIGAYWYMHEPGRAFAVVLSVLVVTCPCALSLATPVALTVATGVLMKKGLLITRGHAIETLSRVTDMVFDKTGTLTEGRLQLHEIKLEQSKSGLDKSDYLAIAAALEAQSEHPIAKLFAPYRDETVTATEINSTAGAGIEGRINDELWWIGKHKEHALVLAKEGQAHVIFNSNDQPRSKAADVIKGLKQMGIRIHLLSGDTGPRVQRVADQLAIAHPKAEVSPQDKLDYVRQLQSHDAVVAMVGDGINDAPVLAGSDVSIAMGGGAELAHASADVVLLSDHIEYLLEGIRMSNKTTRKIKQNLAWAILYNLTALPLAASGIIPPWAAALGMSASSLVVVANAMGLRSA